MSVVMHGIQNVAHCSGAAQDVDVFVRTARSLFTEVRYISAPSALATARAGQRSKKRYQTHRGKVSIDLLRIVIAILLPPLGVFLQVGIGKQFWINVLLTILGYIPGIVHAVWVVARY